MHVVTTHNRHARVNVHGCSTMQYSTYLGEGVGIRDIVHQGSTLSISVVYGPERVKPLLTRGVPDHQLHAPLAYIQPASYMHM